MKQLDIPIIQSSYKFYLELQSYQKQISKNTRYTLWKKCENCSLRILEMLIQAGYLNQKQRLNQLITISAQIDMLRIFLRLAFDTKVFNQKKHIEFLTSLDEIGRMLGGWLKSIKKETEVPEDSQR
ncbi:MAG: diversity-generating retroelement protein Avd [Bdellovibrionales bacterium]|nr:diversity-generating retroelement protein Avd [Bdellovibrionales bacterium]